MNSKKEKTMMELMHLAPPIQMKRLPYDYRSTVITMPHVFVGDIVSVTMLAISPSDEVVMICYARSEHEKDEFDAIMKPSTTLGDIVNQSITNKVLDFVPKYIGLCCIHQDTPIGFHNIYLENPIVQHYWSLYTLEVQKKSQKKIQSFIDSSKTLPITSRKRRAYALNYG